jgi:hypothetical protein
MDYSGKRKSLSRQNSDRSKTKKEIMKSFDQKLFIISPTGCPVSFTGGF